MRWHPILSDVTKQRARETIGAIAKDMASLRRTSRPDVSLSGGQAGLAVFYAWLGAADDSVEAEEVASECRDAAIDAVSAKPMGVSLYAGFTGVAWAVELLDRLQGRAGDDRSGMIDEVLLDVLARGRGRMGHYDLVSGLTGLGVYALERYPRPVAAECIELILQRLSERAERDQDGIYWWTSPELLGPTVRERYPSGGIDLGVAHGVAGVIALLGGICATGVGYVSARPLLADAVRWLLAQAIFTPTGPSFPAYVGPGITPTIVRSAWCYGDPGVAAALLVAARGAGEPKWEREAIALAIRAAQRSQKDSGVVDASICHGTAGLAHLYNRMYQATGDSTLAEAARSWIEATLEYCDQAQAKGGLWVKGSDDPLQGPWSGLGLLEGASGVGLVLLAACTSIEPAWDRMLLVCPPESPNR